MDDFASSIKQDNQGNYFISATTNSYGIGSESNMYLIKLDSIGDSLWTRTYGGNLEETANGLWITNDGGCVLVGQSNSFSNGNLNGYIVKTNENGDTLWTKNYGGIGIETFNSVQQTIDNGYVMAGYTNSIGAGDFDMLLLKMDSIANYSINTEINENPINYHDRKLIKIVDVLGRESKPNKKGLLFYIYDNGMLEKRIIIE
jgi:hypothetical protein